MTATTATPLALVAHAREVSAVERRRFRDRVRPEAVGGGLLLETCHRVEFYAAFPRGRVPSRLTAALPTGGHALTGEAAIRHAVAVAVGRDSVVVGEDQVLHQMRRALDAASATGTLDPVLERLFATALRAGRRARSWREAPPRSLADVAIDRIERQAGTLTGRDILIVGAGKIGALATRSAMAAGASVAVTSRSVDRAADLARATGARVETFEIGRDVGRFVGIVVALSGPWPTGRGAIDALRGGATVVVDLSVPAAISGRLSAVLGRRLTTADDLANADPAAHPIPDRILARLDVLIDQAADEFKRWVDAHEHRAAARALVERADREREAELAELWRRLPDLDPQARATIEGMTRHLAERLLRDPLERLGSDADGRHEQAVRDLWAL